MKIVSTLTNYNCLLVSDQGHLTSPKTVKSQSKFCLQGKTSILSAVALSLVKWVYKIFTVLLTRPDDNRNGEEEQEQDQMKPKVEVIRLNHSVILS